MEVTLVVLSGKRAGKEVPVVGPKFYIGRAEDCHLRPHSDLVSRHHCVLLVEKGYVALRDFGSKNGTVVNGKTVKGEQQLKDGDRLKIGDLEFEVHLGVDVGGKKKPKVESVQEAAARTVESSAVEDMDLDSWLADASTQTLEPMHAAEEETVDKKAKKRKKKGAEVPGVWSKGRWKPTSEDPREAAADTLKNFFKNRS